MRKKERNMWPVWFLVVIVLLHLLVLLPSYFSYYNILKLVSNIHISVRNFAPYEIAVLVIMGFEIFIYRFFRQKKVNVLWVRLHLWILLIALVLIPLGSILLLTIVPNYFSLQKTMSFLIVFIRLRFYLNILLLLTAHIFFLLVLIEWLRKKAPIKIDEGNDGLLNEFAGE